MDPGSRVPTYREALHNLRLRIDTRISQLNLLPQVAKPVQPQKLSDFSLKITSTSGLVKKLVSSIFYYSHVVEDIYCQAEGCKRDILIATDPTTLTIWHRMIACHTWILNCLSNIYYLVPKSDNAQSLSYCFHEIIKLLKILSFVAVEHELDDEVGMNNLSIMGIEMVEFDERDFEPHLPPGIELTPEMEEMANDPLCKDVVVPSDKRSLDLLIELCRRYQMPEFKPKIQAFLLTGKNLRNFLFTMFNCRVHLVNEALFKWEDRERMIDVLFARITKCLIRAFDDKMDKAKALLEVIDTIKEAAEQYFECPKIHQSDLKRKLMSELNFYSITEYLFATDITKQSQVDTMLLRSNIFFKRFLLKIHALKFEEEQVEDDDDDENRSRGGQSSTHPFEQHEKTRSRGGFFCETNKCDETCWSDLYFREVRIDLLDAFTKLAQRHFGKSSLTSDTKSHLQRFCPKIMDAKKMIRYRRDKSETLPQLVLKPPYIRSSLTNIIKLFDSLDEDLEDIPFEKLFEALYKESLDKNNRKLKFAEINTLEDSEPQMYEGEGVNPMLQIKVNPCPDVKDLLADKDLHQLCFLGRHIDKLSKILQTTEDVKTKMADWKNEKGSSVPQKKSPKHAKGGSDIICEQYEVYRKPQTKSACDCSTNIFLDEIEGRMRQSYDIIAKTPSLKTDCRMLHIPTTSDEYSKLVKKASNKEKYGDDLNVEQKLLSSGTGDDKFLRISIKKMEEMEKQDRGMLEELDFQLNDEELSLANFSLPFSSNDLHEP